MAKQNRWKSLHWATKTYLVGALLLFLLVGLGGFLSSCTPGGWFCFAHDPAIFVIAAIAAVIWPVLLLYVLWFVVGGLI